MRLHDLFDLSGQVAIVTGGSRGLGLQIAEALGEFGAKLVLAARRPGELEEAVAHLARMGIEADGVPTDLSGPDAIGDLADRAMAIHGRIDILVNNAGVAWGQPAEEHSLEGWNKVIDLNLTGLFLMCQAVAKRAMIPAGRGRIVNMASIEGLKTHPPGMVGTAAYNASKGGVISLTRALAAEWGRHGITVNAIAPGYFPSKMTRQTIAAHEQLLLDHTVLGKLGGPDDIKGAALLFSSAAGGHITGQTLPVDGGTTII